MANIKSLAAAFFMGLYGLFHYADVVAAAVGVWKLPHDLMEELMAFTSAHEILPFAFLAIGIFLSQFVAYDAWMGRQRPENTAENPADDLAEKSKQKPDVKTMLFFALVAAIVPLLWYFFGTGRSSQLPRIVPSSATESLNFVPDVFGEVYEKHKNGLGSPKGIYVKSKASTQLWADNALIFWVSNPGRLCAIPIDVPATRNGICVDDVGQSSPVLFEEERIRKELKLKKDELAPLGGLYKIIKKDPQQWGWISHIRASCELLSDSVYYQKFDEGDIYGPFQRTPNKQNTAFFLIFTRSSGLEYVDTAQLPPPVKGCREPLR
jgi:hypothetical protein